MPAPIYLFTGPEAGERNDEIAKIKKSLKQNYGEIDEHLFFLQETSLDKIMTILQSGTLFSSAVCIVCRNAELLKKKDEFTMIEEWLKSEPVESSVLILVSDDISVDSKLEKLIPVQNKKKFWEMFEDRKLPWIYDFFRKNSYSITEDAAELILEMIENNTESLKQECSRFFLCFPKNHEITSSEVDAILSHNREESAFSLFNKISDSSSSSQKRFEDAVNILQKIRLSKNSSSVMLIAGLTSCFRKLSLWHKIYSENGAPDDFVLKTNGFASKLMQKQYRNASKIWTYGQTVAILSVLASTDATIRSDGTFLEEISLQKMLYEIIMLKGASCQIADYSTEI